MRTPTSVLLDEQLTAQLDTLVTLTERPKTWHIEQALRDYITREMEFLDAVAEGLRAAEEGDVVEHAEVEAIMDEHRRRFAVREP